MKKETSDLIGQRQLRLEHMNDLKAKGIDPFPSKAYRTTTTKEVTTQFGEIENSEVTVAGRVRSFRKHGKIVFSDIEDDFGRLQIYIKSDELAETNTHNGNLGFEDLKLIDLGDFIEVTGKVTRTQRGEISILPKYVRILAKALRPLPLEIEDKEERFRRRYVDMAINPDIRKRFKRRALFWKAHRDFLDQKGFSEINIPVLEHIPGGGDAVPFITHMNAIDEDFYLRISHELPLKRLIGAGFEKVYDIGPRFRNEGLSDEHLPEHVAMEFYWAYADWRDGMRLVKELYMYILDTVYGGKRTFNIRGYNVKFSDAWEEIDFAEIFRERYGIKDVYKVTLEEIIETLKKEKIDFDEKTVNIPRGVDSLWKKIRKTVAGPAFLINHPKYLSPLQKASTANPLMVERFQPIIAGSELGNGWSEVNDPIDQYERFVEQQKLRDKGDEEAQWLDIDYVEMMEYGMPPNFGYGHSERVFWFLEDVTAREGVPFPQLKFHVSELTKKIYSEIDFDKLKNNNKNELDSLKNANLEGLPTREEALRLLEEHVKDEYQVQHSKMVAAAMSEYAKKFNENEDLWYITGLLHDLDYYEYPELHPQIALKWFKEWGYPEELIHAVDAHYVGKGPEPKSRLAAALIACDELSGFLYAYSLMRPNKFNGMNAKGVRKRLKDKNFAAKISREDISFGIEKLGVDFNEHVELLIRTFQNF